jgi:hypothetical protein
MQHGPFATGIRATAAINLENSDNAVRGGLEFLYRPNLEPKFRVRFRFLPRRSMTYQALIKNQFLRWRGSKSYSHHRHNFWHNWKVIVFFFHISSRVFQLSVSAFRRTGLTVMQTRINSAKSVIFEEGLTPEKSGDGAHGRDRSRHLIGKKSYVTRAWIHY